MRSPDRSRSSRAPQPAPVVHRTSLPHVYRMQLLTPQECELLVSMMDQEDPHAPAHAGPASSSPASAAPPPSASRPPIPSVPEGGDRGNDRVLANSIDDGVGGSGMHAAVLGCEREPPGGTGSTDGVHGGPVPAASEAWDSSPDTVDQRPVMQRTIMYSVGAAGAPRRFQPTAPHRRVYHPAAYSIVDRICEQSIIPAISSLYHSPREDISLGWAYVRRYDPAVRNSLREHSDITDITVNISLSALQPPDDQLLYLFSGEETFKLAEHKRAFFARIDKASQRIGENTTLEEWHSAFQGRCDPRGEWEREFERLYPLQELAARTLRTTQGQALMHPGAYNHGVLPVARGLRHTLLLFFNIAGGIRSARRFLPVLPLPPSAPSRTCERSESRDVEGDADEVQCVDTDATYSQEAAQWAQEDEFFNTAAQGLTAVMMWGQGWWRLPLVMSV